MSNDHETALCIRMGNEPGRSFRVKAPGLVVLEKSPLASGSVITAIVPTFARGAVAFSGEQVNRMFVLEPSDEPNAFDFGRFGIAGRYRVVEKVNDPEQASKCFREFRAE